MLYTGLGCPYVWDAHPRIYNNVKPKLVFGFVNFFGTTPTR